MGTLPQALKIIFEVQRKRSNEKITKREINFPTYKTFLFHVDPSYFQTSYFFNFLFILNDFKC